MLEDQTHSIWSMGSELQPPKDSAHKKVISGEMIDEKAFSWEHFFGEGHNSDPIATILTKLEGQIEEIQPKAPPQIWYL